MVQIRQFILRRDRNEAVYRIGVLISRRASYQEFRSIHGKPIPVIGNWFYDAKQTYKRLGHIIEMLVDIISKNGTMLL
jgi:alpha-L-fucosidase